MSTLGLVVTTVSTVVAAVWFLSNRINALCVEIQTLAGKIDREVASMGGRVDSIAAKIEGQVGVLAGEMRGLSSSIVSARDSREKIWDTVNSVRERLAAIEKATESK